MNILTVFTCLSAFVVSALAQTTVSCTECAPNPIASIYPTNITGTINGTIAIIPIPLTLARSIIPSEYAILTEAYQALLPNFPSDLYPLLVRMGCNHGIEYEAFGISVPDFMGAHVQFPFIDLLGDGYSSFQYQQYLVVSNNSNAINGVLDYGGTPIVSAFEPVSQAYQSNLTGETTFSALDATGKSIVGESFCNNSFGLGPYPLSFYQNVTNQPQFFNGSTCDNQINIFNTTLSTGENAPVGIVGDIYIAKPYLPVEKIWTNVFGIRVDVAFIENNYLPCESLKGYSGTGNGD